MQHTFSKTAPSSLQSDKDTDQQQRRSSRNSSATSGVEGLQATAAFIQATGLDIGRGEREEKEGLPFFVSSYTHFPLMTEVFVF